MIERLLGGALKAALSSIVAALRDRRRDRALERLGYTSADRDAAALGLNLVRESNEIRSGVAGMSDADVRRLLRSEYTAGGAGG